MIYKIKLADGDTVVYESDKSEDEIKNWISENNFIDLPRSGSVPYGNHGWRRVPKLASYQTKSIVYVYRDIDLEECRENNNKIIEQTKPYVDEIMKYETNRRMRIWLFWNTDNNLNEEDLQFYEIKELEKIIYKFKKYKCKIKK